MINDLEARITGISEHLKLQEFTKVINKESMIKKKVDEMTRKEQESKSSCKIMTADQIGQMKHGIFIFLNNSHWKIV